MPRCYLYRIISCTRQCGGATIFKIVTEAEEDQNFILNIREGSRENWARIVDFDGNEYLAARGQLGSLSGDAESVDGIFASGRHSSHASIRWDRHGDEENPAAPGWFQIQDIVFQRPRRFHEDIGHELRKNRC